MAVCFDVVELAFPDAAPDLSLQAAELILEIGNYKQTRDIDMVLGEMAQRNTVLALDIYDQVIGTSGVRFLQRGLVSLEDVVADPSKRGLGIGRTIVEGAEAMARRQGGREINLASSREAVPFYLHLQYEQLGARIFRKFI